MARKLSFLVLLLMFFTVSVGAEPPRAYWAAQKEFDNAIAGNQVWSIINAGEKIVSILGNASSPEQTDMLATPYYELAKAYEAVGNADRAVLYYQKYRAVSVQKNWTDGIQYADMKIRILTVQFGVYAEGSVRQPEYYGAKFEPENGVLYGSTYNNDSRIGNYQTQSIEKYFPNPGSMYLMYLEFGQELSNLAYYKPNFEDAKENDRAVMLAWNTYDDMSDIDSQIPYIKRNIDWLAAQGAPTFLRFANEMNIGPNGANPESYIKAFRIVAGYAKTKSNIAVIWSPNDVSNLERPFENYYPGDEYVDWVGVSSYQLPYFSDRVEGDMDIAESYFLAGKYNHPLLRMKPILEFMERNNIKKPVMITEGGTAHHVNDKNEDRTDWAVQQLRLMYTQIFRMYPQVKAINYFNVHMADEANDYSLYRNQKLNEEYNRIVSEEPYFIKHFGETAAVPMTLGGFYQEGKLVLSAAAYYPQVTEYVVRYVVDGQPFDTGTPPYRYELQGLTDGLHKLQVQMVIGGTVYAEKSYQIRMEGGALRVSGDAVSIVLNRSEIPCDQPPVVENDRVLVPIRAVTEALGALVDWDAQTQTAVIKKDNSVVKLTISSTEAFVNGAAKALDVPARLIGGRTMIPVRFLSENFGCKVDWDGDIGMVWIEN